MEQRKPDAGLPGNIDHFSYCSGGDFHSANHESSEAAAPPGFSEKADLRREAGRPGRFRRLPADRSRRHAAMEGKYGFLSLHGVGARIDRLADILGGAGIYAPVNLLIRRDHEKID